MMLKRGISFAPMADDSDIATLRMLEVLAAWY